MPRDWFLDIDYGNRRVLRVQTELINEHAIPERVSHILAVWFVKSLNAINARTGEIKMLFP